MFSDKKSNLNCQMNCFSPTGKVSFFFGCFQKFSLSLVLRSLIMICFGMYFFGFILYGVFSASWICMFMSLAKFGKFLVIIIYFSPTLSQTWMLHICYSPTGPFGCVLFFFFPSLFSLCYSDLVITIFLSSSLLKHFSVFSILLLSPSTEFYFSFGFPFYIQLFAEFLSQICS